MYNSKLPSFPPIPQYRMGGEGGGGDRNRNLKIFLNLPEILHSKTSPVDDGLCNL